MTCHGQARSLDQSSPPNYNACFSSSGRPLPGCLQKFISSIEIDAKNADPNSRSQQPSYLPLAYIEIGNYSRAEQLLQKMLRDQQHSSAQPGYLANPEFDDWLAMTFAGLHSLQGRWRLAIGDFGHFLYGRAMHCSLQLTFICLAWLALWPLSHHLGQEGKPAGRRRLTIWLAFLPPMMYLSGLMIETLLNRVLFGDGLSYLVLNYNRRIVTLLSSTIVNSLLICLAFYLLSKNRIDFSKRTVDREDRQEAHDAPKEIGAVRTLIGFIVGRTIIVVAALALNWLPAYSTYYTALYRLPSMISNHLHHGGIHPIWPWALINIGIATPIAEEYIWRGIIYRIIRQQEGIGFAIIYSSITFAAMHVHLQSFYVLLWAGIVYAVVYEKTNNLMLPIIVHSIHNIFGFVNGWYS